MKSIKVAGNTYKIEYLPQVVVDGEEYLGICDYERNLIQVNENLPDDRLKNVLFHEIFHAILYESGYLEHDEDMVVRVSNVLKQVYDDLEGIQGVIDSGW